jgi:hypothetical protein
VLDLLSGGWPGRRIAFNGDGAIECAVGVIGVTVIGWSGSIADLRL